jgi:hypothetical protein
VLSEELNRVLRFERGLTYGVGVDVDRLSADVAHVTFGADTEPPRRAALAEGLVEIVLRLAEEGVPKATLDRRWAEFEQYRAEEPPERTLDRHVINRLLGAGVSPPGPSRPPRPADVRAVFREMADTALVLLPYEAAEPADPRFVPVPVWSAGPVEGTWYPPVGSSFGSPADRHLVCGPEGVSIATPEGVVTVRFAETVATGWWTNGARWLVGADGFRVQVVPGEWERGAEVVAWLDRMVPPHTLVPLGDGGPEYTPPPPPPRGIALLADRHLTLATIVGALLSLLFLAVAADGPRPETETSAEVTPGEVAVSWAIGGAFLLATVGAAVLRVRRVREARRRGEPPRGLPRPSDSHLTAVAILCGLVALFFGGLAASGTEPATATSSGFSEDDVRFCWAAAALFLVPTVAAVVLRVRRARAGRRRDPAGDGGGDGPAAPVPS